MTYGTVLKQWLLDNNLSQAAFSKLVPCTPALISYYVRDKYIPPFRTAMRIQELTNNKVSASLLYTTEQETIE